MIIKKLHVFGWAAWLISGFSSNLALFKCYILSYSLSLLFEPNKYLLVVVLECWHAHIHTRTCRADKRPIPATTSVWVMTWPGLWWWWWLTTGSGSSSISTRSCIGAQNPTATVGRWEAEMHPLVHSDSPKIISIRFVSILARKSIRIDSSDSIRQLSK